VAEPRPDAIVYENGGVLHEFNLATGKRAVSHRGPRRRRRSAPEFKSVAQSIAAIAFSVGSSRLVEARGNLTVPAEHGSIRTLTTIIRRPRAEPGMVSDGKSIAYLSDKLASSSSTLARNGGTNAHHTDGGSIVMARVVPDSKKLLYWTSA